MILIILYLPHNQFPLDFFLLENQKALRAPKRCYRMTASIQATDHHSENSDLSLDSPVTGGHINLVEGSK